MIGKLSLAQHAMLGAVVVAAGAGWIFALYQNQEIGVLRSDLERQTFAKEEHEQAQRDLMTAQIERDRCHTEAEILASKAKSPVLESEFESCQAELEELQKRQILPDGGTLQFRTKARARVRAGPSTDTDEVAVVPAGKTIQVFEAVEDGSWYKVGGMGYIFHELLEPVDEGPAE